MNIPTMFGSNWSHGYREDQNVKCLRMMITMDARCQKGCSLFFYVERSYLTISDDFFMLLIKFSSLKYDSRFYIFLYLFKMGPTPKMLNFYLLLCSCSLICAHFEKVVIINEKFIWRAMLSEIISKLVGIG
jgi:hypothetical protein